MKHRIVITREQFQYNSNKKVKQWWLSIEVKNAPKKVLRQKLRRQNLLIKPQWDRVKPDANEGIIKNPRKDKRDDQECDMPEFRNTAKKAAEKAEWPTHIIKYGLS
jgi:phage pi2 protein 07